MRWTRRRVLRAALAGGGVALLPRAGAVAQGGGTGLLRAPKVALVIGNSRYQQAPLRNPVNDANGIAAALKSVGFSVTLGLELGRSEMRDAIRAYTGGLARSNAVGLFYFAGHGAQLAWRNYMIPLDVEIGDIQELREQGVDVNSLIDGIRKAGNPMNIIILDACRDNPFGSTRRLDQKGLSQLDAPPGTLLAYATAPGNTAADGEDAHGLYTEHLLRQIGVPEAKVEDVFKRVRLAVRRQSKGLQIPWESTSLEEDFWFVPPQALAALAAEEAERERRRELALLEKRRAEEEAERNRKRELALKEAQRVTEEAERKRREEQALREARLAEEEAARKYQQELALREKQRAQEEAERRREREQAAVRKPNAALVERLFEEELAIWERIKVSSEPGPLEDYLMRYPSGRYSELAQLRLDQVLARLGEKKIEIVSAPENPYSKGTVAANTAYKVGDYYAYREWDLLTKL
ncbi:MAG: caspase family protein, partial [Betaproteobacteria bacterium]|nr:caspase family protein [Betaproteobacteria bacterium]